VFDPDDTAQNIAERNDAIRFKRVVPPQQESIRIFFDNPMDDQGTVFGRNVGDDIAE